MKKLTVLVLFFAVVMTAESSEDFVFNASTPAPTRVGELIEEARDRYLGAHGLNLGTDNPGGAFIGFAQSAVNVGPDHPGWGSARASAYERAWIAAQSDFIRFQFARISSETVSELFADDSLGIASPHAEPDPVQGQFRRMLQKFLDLSEARQDEALRKMGLNPADYAGSPPAKRRDLFSQQFMRQTLVRSFGEVVGCLPLQTFEAVDEAGSHSIGVILVYSEKLKDFASNVLRGTVQIEPQRAATRPVMEVIGADPARLANQFGVRRLYDTAGIPVLVSFGQAAIPGGTQGTGPNNRQHQRRRDAAMRQARITADSYLAEFLAAQLNLVEESTRGEIFEEFVTTEADGFERWSENAQFLEIFEQRLKRRADLSLSGIADGHTWSFRQPEHGQELVGVVRIWTPASARAAREIRSGRRESDSGREDPATTQEASVLPSGDFEGMMPGDF
ncbi:MAG: hypothetical protein JJT96_11335 [Opitutales bacterium]|nr:hypothetical protein [Opitutales bacterium]